jgi:hypothetical protein
VRPATPVKKEQMTGNRIDHRAIDVDLSHRVGLGSIRNNEFASCAMGEVGRVEKAFERVRVDMGLVAHCRAVLDVENYGMLDTLGADEGLGGTLLREVAKEAGVGLV